MDPIFIIIKLFHVRTVDTFYKVFIILTTTLISETPEF